ncbi:MULTISPECIES: glutathione S-transferase N-terminal domain-containing protein [Rhizobium]|uniref:Glutaredoxin n=1 Tax=Rhizobium paranaense TaxID=1650438 RepID=A0A7W8XYD3_9HYPH|nr:glutathione S-transferase N-terminal domain-containing protein [Rhizobium paranaense]MBB5577635.1 glutaredoxin [Rhizobium paranaense]
MSTTQFTPIIYSKIGCPYCIKLRIFLLEAGLIDRVTFVEGKTPEEHDQLAEFLTKRIGRASFPTGEISPDNYLPESDDLVDHFASIGVVDPQKLPTYQAFSGALLPRLQEFYREYSELKKLQQAK